MQLNAEEYDKGTTIFKNCSKANAYTVLQITHSCTRIFQDARSVRDGKLKLQPKFLAHKNRFSHFSRNLSNRA